MYRDKSFRDRPIEHIIVEIVGVKYMGGSWYVGDAVLADSDAMTPAE